MFGKKTVDSVIASFKKTVADLRVIDEQQRAEVSRITNRILDLQADRTTASCEADRARSIADKLDQLFG